MDWDWLPATVGVFFLILQGAYLLGTIREKLKDLERRMERIEKALNGLRKGG